MQLIPETEPALAIERNMSVVEDIQNEKIGSDTIEVISRKCNGNKENIKDINVITTNDVNNKATIELDGALQNPPLNTNSENNDSESSDKATIKEICVVNNFEEIKEVDNLEKEMNVVNTSVDTSKEKCVIKENIEVNSVQTKESQTNCTDKKNCSISIEKHETENNHETVQEGSVKNEDGIIGIKEENLNQILEVAKKEIEVKVVKENETCDQEESLSTKDDVEVVEQPTEIPIKSETTIIEELNESHIANAEEDIRVIEESTEILIKSDAIIDVWLKEGATKGDPGIALKPDSTKEIELIETDIPTTQDDVEAVDKCKTTTDISRQLDESDKIDSSKIQDKKSEDDENLNKTPNVDSTEVIASKDIQDSSTIELNDDMDVEEIVEESKTNNKQDIITPAKETAPINTIIDKPVICKLSNTLDILSDDEEEPLKEVPLPIKDTNEKQCINIEDDDDIMLIDEDTSKTDKPLPVDTSNNVEPPIKADDKTNLEMSDKTIEERTDLFTKTEQKESTQLAEIQDPNAKINISEKQEQKLINTFEPEKPLLPDSFLKTAKKNLADMTREDLEEFCILKIVESIVDRSNLSEIKNKLKSLAQGIEEYRKKAMMLTKQNRDLQVVLKSVQEEQKKMTPDSHITPLKITRSVGMQVFMEKAGARRKSLAQLQSASSNNLANRQNVRNVPAQNIRPQKPPVSNQPIPVPRLVPAVSPAMKTPSTIPLVNQITPSKPATPIPNGIKTPSPSQKVAEKRQHNRIMSVTVDLTDDEPPLKINNNRTSPAPPVRLVPPQNLMANPRQPYTSPVNSPRKVYIPISGPQSQSIRPGQTIMLKTVPGPGMRQRCPAPQVARVPQSAVRMSRIQTGRHPAPLPDAMKQYQPPNWKALPPAPDLKLSKVENGIVISWKIEGYQEDSYEEIASYQLYAYQETSSPPSTALWKKIGDVKALPLPMACTLTQFMAGFKYYFAVRAVDIRSRLGPFSLPGSILLLNKL